MGKVNADVSLNYTMIFLSPQINNLAEAKYSNFTSYNTNSAILFDSFRYNLV
jgi:hypothetical protein